MLSVPVLDDLSFDKLFERARSQIPMYTGEWTDFNHSDPGITVLQTFSWLTDVLNYYIDATGEEHRLAYLRLLGIGPEKRAASCNLSLKSGGMLNLARGAKLLAGDVVFELAESYGGAPNEVTALWNKAGNSYIDLTPFAGADGDYAPIFAKTGSSTLFIGFSAELSGEVRLYVEVPLHERRNTFEDDFRLVDFSWEYYNGVKWLPVRVLSDETGGFLKSGFISLSLDGSTKPIPKHKSLPRANYLRVQPSGGAFDAQPRIGRIHANCVRCEQTDTFAQTIVAEYDGSGRLPIDWHVSADDVVCVAVAEDGGFSLWFEHIPGEDSLCDVVEGDHPWQRVVVFDKERFGVCPEAGQKILVTVTRAELYEKMQLGITHGYARERMEVDLPDLVELRLGLVEERNGRAFFELWDSCESISEAAYDAPVFVYQQNAVQFGDGLAGLQPAAGRMVVVMTAKSSRLDGGNVRAGSIDRFADASLGDVVVTNPQNAEGGARPKTSRELEPEIEALLARKSRAVTERDYMDIVAATPGLMIDAVSVVSGAEYTGISGQPLVPGAVFVVVKPYSGFEKRPALNEDYRRRIREHLEPYRLITTDVRVVSARYVGIEVYGRVTIRENTPHNRQMVERALLELIDCEYVRRFGFNVIYGKVFSRLEMMEQVARVSQLSFSCLGDGAEKSDQGDILVSPDAMTYLAGVSIEYV